MNYILNKYWLLINIHRNEHLNIIVGNNSKNARLFNKIIYNMTIKKYTAAMSLLHKAHTLQKLQEARYKGISNQNIKNTLTLRYNDKRT